MFLEYEKEIRAYRAAFEILSELIGDRERLFLTTQPRSVDYETDRVQTSPQGDAMINYLIRSEALENRISEAEKVLKFRKSLIKSLEDDLKQSKNKYDQVYYRKKVLMMPVWKIAKELSYSEPHIYYLLRKIDAQLKMIKNDNPNII